MAAADAERGDLSPIEATRVWTRAIGTVILRANCDERRRDVLSQGRVGERDRDHGRIALDLKDAPIAEIEDEVVPRLHVFAARADEDATNGPRLPEHSILVFAWQVHACAARRYANTNEAVPSRDEVRVSVVQMDHRCGAPRPEVESDHRERGGWDCRRGGRCREVLGAAR